MTVEIKMPQMGESIAEGTVTRWFKKVGDPVKRDEPLFEISTDKVDAEVPSPGDGVLMEIRVDEGVTVEVNSVVALLGNSDGGAAAAVATPPETKRAEKNEPTAPAAEPAPPLRTEDRNGRKVRSSPLVRKIAREHGIDDLSVIPGSGANGRVT